MNGGAGNDTRCWNNGDGSDRINGDAGNDGTEVNGNAHLGDAFTLEADAGGVSLSAPTSASSRSTPRPSASR